MRIHHGKAMKLMWDVCYAVPHSSLIAHLLNERHGEMGLIGADQQEAFLEDVNQEAWCQGHPLEDYCFVTGQKVLPRSVNWKKLIAHLNYQCPLYRMPSMGVHWYLQYPAAIFFKWDSWISFNSLTLATLKDYKLFSFKAGLECKGFDGIFLFKVNALQYQVYI